MFSVFLLCCGMYVNAQSNEKRGYRGFVDLGYGVYLDNPDASGIISLFTSHGYQFNPYLFLGAGIGAGIQTNPFGDVYIPVFADARISVPIKKVTPFVGMKIGHSISTESGFYMNPNIGVKIASIIPKHPLTITVGYFTRFGRQWKIGGY